MGWVVSSPWQSVGTTQPEQEYLALLSYLRLKGYGKMLDLMRRSRSVSEQLVHTSGLVGFTMRAKLLRHRFWTLCTWEDERALMDFVRTSPYRDAMAVLQPHMAETSFVRWSVKGADLPLRWEDALRRMPSGPR